MGELLSAESLNKNLERQMVTLQRKLDKLIRKQQEPEKPKATAAEAQDLKRQVDEGRARLSCPICHRNDKSAILTKCMHTFCYECLNKRYETRQRKCPKCGLAFGKH